MELSGRLKKPLQSSGAAAAIALAVACLLLAPVLALPCSPRAEAAPYSWDGGYDARGAPFPAATAYFAEGTTRNGFEEYLVLRNPGSKTAAVTIKYVFQAPERPVLQSLSLGPGAGAGIRVNDRVGPGRDVSVLVAARPGVVCERQVYFNYKGLWTGGHVTSGALAPSKRWYFAEGTTRQGFAEWLCVQNPTADPATVDLDYILGTGENRHQSLQVQAFSRATVDVNAAVGPGQDVSVALASSSPVVAERPMYFDYRGAWRGGDTVTGANAVAREWSFAEGTTRRGFEEWLCIENPGDATTAEVDYLFADGTSSTRGYALPGHARTTLSVNSEAGPEKDVSIRVRSAGDVLCERAMYFLYHGAWEGGHVVMGSTRGRATWYFPTAAIRPNSESWLCLANPGPEANPVKVAVYSAGAAPREQTAVLAPMSRSTLSLDALAAGLDDPWVVVTGAQALDAERPTYFAYDPQVEPEPFTIATCDGVELKSPIRYCDLLGCQFHEAEATASDGASSGAQVMQPVGLCMGDYNPGRLHPAVSLAVGNDPAYFIEDTRSRGSYSTTACDVHSKAGATVYSPVNGTVLRAEGYSLYGRYPDLMAYIAIDGKPGLVVAILHMDSLKVSKGQRVEAGRTPVGTVRDLVPYFYSGPNPWTREEGNHAHIQVNYRPDLHL